ncbi:hypothetical protein Y032_0306g1993 [Ancylostoma ceylanicum]|uniref:Uncharacterized protein n=1 Tax=Ancylostoma ceylanicum TaxID=53326 RepID=A0A016S3F2_9BILA|nr:hypothetical protein Y032_0306g1993 [Ancylostoma ceylanicum]
MECCFNFSATGNTGCYTGSNRISNFEWSGRWKTRENSKSASSVTNKEFSQNLLSHTSRRCKAGIAASQRTATFRVLGAA